MTAADTHSGQRVSLHRRCMSTTSSAVRLHSPSFHPYSRFSSAISSFTTPARGAFAGGPPFAGPHPTPTASASIQRRDDLSFSSGVLGILPVLTDAPIRGPTLESGLTASTFTKWIGPSFTHL